MRLSEFIQANHKTIIEEWVAFARTILPWAEGMSEKDLRDHAAELLTAVANDMKSPQSDLEKSDKSKGKAEDGKLARVGRRHATDRLETGLDLNQLVSEYRALRASVLRLWEEAQGEEQGEVTRFNEAIDEALGMSMAQYSKTVETTREQFLGVLGHDLRNPIGAITMGAALLADSDDAETAEVATSILNSGERMSRMVADLLDLTRTRLGSGIPVTLKPMELGAVCRSVISELQAIHPDRHVVFEQSGDLHGEWDGDRLAQVVSNLVANALQYGDPDEPVSVDARRDGEDVVLQVHNAGAPIPENALKTIFTPLARHQPGGQNADKNVTGLGLGLYIAHEIVLAHGGTIGVTSFERKGTTFTVRVPGRPVAPSARETRESPRTSLS